MFYSYDVNVIVIVYVQPDDLVHSLLFNCDDNSCSFTPPYEHDIVICVTYTTSYCEYEILPLAVNSELLTRLNDKLIEP